MSTKLTTAKLRRGLFAPLAVGSLVLGLAACDSGSGETTTDDATTGETTQEEGADETADDAASGGFSSGNAAYDEIINGGAVADDATVEANEWASAVKAAGQLHVGGTETSDLFSLLDPTSGVAIGFDAGLSQLLSRYILGEANTKLTQVTVDTREDLLVNNSVDVIFATYTITPERLERVGFAGPYYESQQAILVQADNEDINSVEDLAGKNVATQAASVGVTALEEFAPEASILELPDHAQALTAVQQGRADAYVIDQTLLLNALVSNDDVKIVGEPFGSVDPYGIGVNKDSDAQEFIDAWLQSIIDDGTWEALWHATIGEKSNSDALPALPELGSAGN